MGANKISIITKHDVMGKNKKECQILTTAYPEPFPQESSEHDKQVFHPLQ